jgi:hypothetical protein
LAAVVAAAAVFTIWAGAAQASDPNASPVAWSPGPDLPIAGAQIVRLSADRILALRSSPRTCVVGPGGCVPAYDALPGVVLDVRRGTSTPILGPPPGMQLASRAVGLDGDAYFQLRDATDPEYRRGGADPSALARYVGTEDRWERVPLPPGLTGRFWLSVAGPRLVAWDIRERTSAGKILGADGQWRDLPPNPLWAGQGRGGGLYASGGQLLVVRNLGPLPESPTTCGSPGACASSVVSLTISADGRPASEWRALPEIPFPVDGPAEIIGHYLTWSAATYDLRTGRTVRIPEDVRKPGQVRVVDDGVVLGHRLTTGGGLFDPDTRRWIPIPNPPRPETTQSSTPDPAGAVRVDERPCGYLGGADNIIRFCPPPTRVVGSPPFGVIDSGGAIAVDVLRVSDEAAGG